jgi:hypothetical protein
VQGTGTNPDQMLTARERGIGRIRESAQGKNMNRKILKNWTSHISIGKKRKTSRCNLKNSF